MVRDGAAKWLSERDEMVPVSTRSAACSCDQLMPISVLSVPFEVRAGRAETVVASSNVRKSDGSNSRRVEIVRWIILGKRIRDQHIRAELKIWKVLVQRG